MIGAGVLLLLMMCKKDVFMVADICFVLVGDCLSSRCINTIYHFVECAVELAL